MLWPSRCSIARIWFSVAPLSPSQPSSTLWSGTPAATLGSLRRNSLNSSAMALNRTRSMEERRQHRADTLTNSLPASRRRCPCRWPDAQGLASHPAPHTSRSRRRLLRTRTSRSRAALRAVAISPKPSNAEAANARSQRLPFCNRWPR